MTESSIKILDQTSIRRICTGQVIVDLSTAIKEIIENSLDAGATSIEIKLKDMGVESIEVIDNGIGINPCNYEGIALKHHTSKIINFNDLTNVNSFGFRGEAINAICELSGKLLVVTKQSNEAVGCTLDFERNGVLKSMKPTPRATGTTVIIDKLFDTLPVRRSEFVRSIKKQYQNLLKVLQSYAVISVGVKIVVVNFTKGVKQIVIGTQGTNKMEDNISAVFGSKFLGSLIPISITINPLALAAAAVGSSQSNNYADDDDDEEEKEEKGKGKDMDKEDTSNYSSQICYINGFISKTGLGVGRSDNDRQFIYCNGRPVDMSKFTKVLNDVWRRYEMKQKPACILDVHVPAGSFDVNLTPDKREVVLLYESILLEQLQLEIDRKYAPSRYTFPLSHGLGATQQSTILSFTQASVASTASTSASNAQQSFTESSISTYAVDAEPMIENFIDDTAIDAYAIDVDMDMDIDMDMDGLINGNPVTAVASDTYPSVGATAMAASSITWLTPEEAIIINERSRGSVSDIDDTNSVGISGISDDKGSGSTKNVFNLPVRKRRNAEAIRESDALMILDTHSSHQQAGDATTDHEPHTDRIDSHSSSVVHSDNDSQSVGECIPVISIIDDDSSDALCVDIPTVWSFDYKDVAARIDRDMQSHAVATSPPSPSLSLYNQCHDVASATTAAVANSIEDEGFARVLRKSDFMNMRVVGQFNLGFMICQLNNDLYLLDQHACDEKYRFEMLQQTTSIHRQPLISPLTIETSASEEMIIIEHIDVFESNGFLLIVDETKPSGSKVSLLAVPFSKSTQFGIDDVHELASILSECDTTATSTKLQATNDDLFQKNKRFKCLPKIISMFASRACRSAVMIGTALKEQDMRQIVSNLATIEQPWNCPHGRPTMRHMVDLRRLLNSRQGS